MMRKRGRKGTIEIIGGVLLIAAALFWTMNNFHEARRAGVHSESILSSLEEMLPAETASAPLSSKTENPESDEVHEQESERIYPDYVLNPKMEMPVKDVDGTNYVAMLNIPALDLELPVASVWNYSILRASPCRYVGSAYLNNMVIAAHNYDAHFGRLYTLSAGDSVFLTDMDGNIFCYEVAEITTLEATAVSEMTGSGYDLTLFTCTVGGYARVAVRCTQIDGS